MLVLRSGDKIISINNQKIFSVADLQNEISQNLGKKSDWEIVRGVPNLFQKPGESNQFYYDDKLSESYKILARWDPPVNKVGKDISLEKARTSKFLCWHYKLFFLKLQIQLQKQLFLKRMLKNIQIYL